MVLSVLILTMNPYIAQRDTARSKYTITGCSTEIIWLCFRAVVIFNFHDVSMHTIRTLDFYKRKMSNVIDGGERLEEILSHGGGLRGGDIHRIRTARNYPSSAEKARQFVLREFTINLYRNV
jgi:hypothetical protein